MIEDKASGCVLIDPWAEMRMEKGKVSPGPPSHQVWMTQVLEKQMRDWILQVTPSQGVRAIKGCCWELVCLPAQGMKGIWIPTCSNHESATGFTAKSKGILPTELHTGCRRGIRILCAQPNATARRARTRLSASSLFVVNLS